VTSVTRGEGVVAPSPRRARTTGGTGGWRQWLVGYALIAPALIAFGSFSFLPMVFSLAWSFTTYNGLADPVWVGLQNYVDIVNDPAFVRAFLNTAGFVGLTLAIGPALGLLTALALNRALPARGFFRAAFFVPVTTALVVVATIWKLLLNEHGPINAILHVVGVQSHAWLGDPATAMGAIAIASIWQGFGFEMVIFLAALQSVPAELLEAASLDGAGPLRRFWYVTLPHLRPTLVFIFVIGFIGAFQVFDQPYVMTQGGPLDSTSTVVLYLIERFRSLDLGHASAAAYLLVLVLVGLSYAQLRLSRRFT
jgi:multiple sugar transport system permease protein